ncbi:reverse transcriptase domain-containing protein [Methylobacterium sp. NEAU K]|uniref:reverse transcriptase domain-containing protein n=1 Tax=Methylobacterium sp. NEAU K TaxID=3064946 RepID=UPI002736BFAB|nr:reverse transcriptase domain-containing protein [Methylobacterium sp. NEAU K]MDP4006814.1 reverse transcriptase domain-containing protein [Methylobacterium sp. NEAU K]
MTATMLARDHTRSAEGQELVQPVALERSSLPPVVRCLPSPLRKRGKKAHNHAKKMLERIERFVAEGRTRDAAQLARRYGHSHDAKFVALFDANKKLPRGLRTKGAELHKIADEMDLRQPQGSASYRPEPKPKGGYRPVVNFDLPARAAQLLLKRVVRPFLRIREDQFAVENGGAPEEGRRIRDLAAKGYGWFIEGDIANCYASIDPDGVKELLGGNLGRMMEANALSRSVRASIRKTRRKISSIDLSNLQQQVRAGVPQGSSLSPLLTEAVIASVIDDAERHSDWPKTVHLTCHADNIAILSRTKADAGCAADILREAFTRSRFGPLKLLCKDARSIKQGFDFLGIRFIAKRRRVYAEVSPAKMSECVTWISTMVEGYRMLRKNIKRHVRERGSPMDRRQKGRPLTREEQLEDIKRRVRSWGASMGLRKNGRPLTRAAQWANSVLSYALDFQMRGRALRMQASYQHRVLHQPSFMYEHG